MPHLLPRHHGTQRASCQARKQPVVPAYDCRGAQRTRRRGDTQRAGGQGLMSRAAMANHRQRAPHTPGPTPTPSPNTMPKANPNPWAESPPVEPSSQPACQWCQKEQKNHGCRAWSQPVSHHSSLTALGPGVNRWWERSSGLCPTQWAEYLLPPPHRSIFALSLRGVINIHSELSRIRFPMHEDVYYLFIFKAC